MRLVGVKTCAPLLLALLDDPRFRRGETDTAFLERFVADSDWQALPDLNDLPADVPALITAVLWAHGRQGAGRAVLPGDGRTRRSAWLDAGRAEGLR
jgi:hypothetical protein